MLAMPIENIGVKNIIWPAWVQTKFNGHRAIVTRHNGSLIMYSRRGKKIETMSHILEELEPLIKEGDFLDGELYIHGMSLQSIGSYIKRLQEKSSKVEYHVYDLISKEIFADRYKALQNLLKNQELKYVQLVHTERIVNMEELQDFYRDALAKNYEGAMLRISNGKYLAGFRSRALIKVKPSEDAEFEIIAVKAGKDRNVNETQLKVAVFTCKTKDNKEFDVLAPGTQEEKDMAYHNRNNYLGKILTVQFMGYTEDGKPFHPVALQIREDI
jgi:DNA ligase-1